MSDIYTRFASGLLFPVHERLKGHCSVALRRRLERSQWLEPDALLAEQLGRLRAFLADIGQRVPYYRDLFRERGFDPRAVARMKRGNGLQHETGTDKPSP